MGGTSVSERNWQHYDQNFDNVGRALVVLFEIATLEAWPSIAYNAVDSTGENSWPVKDNNKWAVLYFVVFVLMGTFFVAQLFTGVACDKFERYTHFNKGTIFRTEKQQEWVTDAKQITQATPAKIAAAPIVPRLYKVALHPVLDYFIMACICLNVVVLAMYYEGQSQSYEDKLGLINLVFWAIFEVEIIVKILGYGLAFYFDNPWHQFDFLINHLGLIGMFVGIGGLATVFRIFRIARVLKLIPRAQKLQSIVMAAVMSLSALFNVAMLMLLIIVIFSCLGVLWFGEVVHGDFLMTHANFETFGYAMLTLFRISTGEDWNGIMYDCAVTDGMQNSGGNYCYAKYDLDKCRGNGLGANENALEFCCPDSYDGPCGCGVEYLSQFYFIIFNVISAFVLINVVVAGVLMAYQAAKGIFDSGLTNRMIEDFKAKWYKYDPDADARMPKDDFGDLLQDVLPIFQFEKEVDKEVLLKKIPDMGGEIRFTDVLYVLAFEKFGASLGISSKGLKVESRINNRTLMLDNDHNPTKNVVMGKLTEFQVDNMTIDELREELRQRGFVRAPLGTAASVPAQQSYDHTNLSPDATQAISTPTEATKGTAKASTSKQMDRGSNETFDEREGLSGKL